MIKFKLADSQIDERKWDDFVATHPQGNIFQTSQMFAVFSTTKGYEPYRVWAVNSANQRVLGVLQGVLVKEKEGLLGKFSTRAIIQGGPLIAENTSQVVVNRLIEAFDRFALPKAIWSEIWNLSDIGLVFDLIKNYQFEDHLNFQIDLNQSEAELWRKISSTRRQNLHHAERSGVEMVEAQNPKELKEFYKLLQETYQRANLPLVGFSLFEALFDVLVPRGQAKFWLAKHNNRYISAFLALNYNKTIYNWYAGTDPKEYQFYPNSLLAWEVIKWGKANGYLVFDFGGAGKPNVSYGPREFKRQFGGRLVNFGRFIRIYSPWQYYLAHWGLKVYQWTLKQLFRK